MTHSIPCIRKRSFNRPHAHAQVPSHRSPSVERFRVHVKGMVGSPGWLDGFPEVGRRRGPWRGRWAEDLLDASATGKTIRCGTVQRAKDYEKPQSRGDAAIATNRWLEILRSGADLPIVATSSNRRSPRSRSSISSGPLKKRRGGDSRWTQVMNYYYAAVRRELKTLHGKEVVTTGDGLLATFDAPASGVRCATAIREAVRTLGLEIRVGLHAGEYKVSGADVVGLAFTSARASPRRRVPAKSWFRAQSRI